MLFGPLPLMKMNGRRSLRSSSVAGIERCICYFHKEASGKLRSDVLHRLKEWESNYENGDGRLYAIDIQPGGDFEGLCKYLEELDTAKVDYRTEVEPIEN